MKPKLHKDNESLIEDITVRQLREAGQGMVFDELNLNLELQITNNDYMVFMGINVATLYVCLIDRVSNSWAMIKVFANRLARRFINNIDIVSRTSVYQELYDQFFMTDTDVTNIDKVSPNISPASRGQFVKILITLEPHGIF